MFPPSCLLVFHIVVVIMMKIVDSDTIAQADGSRMFIKRVSVGLRPKKRESEREAKFFHYGGLFLPGH